MRRPEERSDPAKVTTLEWKQPKWSVDRFELRGGEEVLGELYWTRCLSDQAIARYGESTWSLDRKGFFRDRAVAVELGTGTPVATFTFDWLEQGNLALADGASFRWYRTKILGPAWTLVQEGGSAVFEIDLGLSLFKSEAAVRLWSDVAAMPKLGLLLCLGMYVAINMMHDAGAAVAGVGAVVS